MALLRVKAFQTPSLDAVAFVVVDFVVAAVRCWRSSVFVCSLFCFVSRLFLLFWFLTTPTSCKMQAFNRNVIKHTHTRAPAHPPPPPNPTTLRWAVCSNVDNSTFSLLAPWAYGLDQPNLGSEFSLTPQWGAADAEIKVPCFETTELKGSPYKAWGRSVCSHICYAYCQGFLRR